ncbi:hypothetical protein JL09_g6315, partial [Pichia kudriavzevii]
SLKNQIFGLSDERKLENPNTSNNQANISVEYSSFSPDGKPVLTDKQKQLPSSLQQKSQAEFQNPGSAQSNVLTLNQFSENVPNDSCQQN